MKDFGKLIETEISSKEVFKGRLLHVFLDEARLPDGNTSTREWIKHPGASAVLPVYENGDVMLIKQFRYPMKQVFYEVPAGKIDSGEEPGITANRELKEEAGLICSEMEYLGQFYPGIGYSDEVIHLYIAWDIHQSEQGSDEDEFVINHRLPFKEAVDMVHIGEISDGKTMITLLKAWQWWQENEPFDIK